MPKWKDNSSALYPVLLAWFSVLSLAAANLYPTGRVEGLPHALLIATIFGMLAWLASGFFSRDADRRLIVSLVFATWFAGYDLLTGGSESGLVFLLSAAVVIAIAITVARLERNMGKVADVLRRTTAIVVLFPLFSAAAAAIRSDSYQTPPSSVDRSAAAGPNVFLIILDKYTGSRSLLQNYGYDNRDFENRLRNRGFVIPSASRSNYPHTRLALASMLNWTLLDSILDSASDPIVALNRSIEDNRTWRFFHERGYEFVFLPTSFPSTQHNRYADRMLPARRKPSGVDIAAAWTKSTAAGQLIPVLRRDEFSAVSARLRPTFPYPVETALEIEEKFAILAELAVEPGKRFVFAHLLVPHEPYIFNADCSHRPPFWPPTDYIEDQQHLRDSYVAQLTCVNQKVEDLVSRILEHSETPPIILLQSDHGHAFMVIDPIRGWQPPFHELDNAQISERTDLFAAYYLPHGGNEIIYDSITPVNVLPVILNHYFGAEIPLQEDAVFWATVSPPFGIRRISAPHE